MKREEIEQLLAEYVNGEISPANRRQLENLFGENPELKKEADEMLAAWLSLNALEENIQPDTAMDDQFYAMLQRAKTDQRMNSNVITINKTWLQVVAAILVCITAFGIGRFTAPPSAPVFKYRTVYIKQPAPVQQSLPTPVSAPVIAQIKLQASAPPAKPVKERVEADDSELAQQLRTSVYTSERIGAVMKITGRGKLNDADLQVLSKALREDPSANVRLAILDALRPLAARQDVQGVLISAMSNQDDQLIQTSIVDMLVDNKSKQAIPQMIVLLDDKNTNPLMQNKIKAGIESFLNDDRATNTGQNRNKAGIESSMN